MGLNSISYFTGDELKTYAKNFLSGIYEKRDFVNSILSYFQDPISNRRIMGISGLRGTGKTVGMLQAIQELFSYDNVLYILINEEIDINTFKELFLKIIKGKEFIFIDEVTKISGLVEGVNFLSDVILPLGKKVVITGTDSLALLDTVKSSLYHRIRYENVTHISFSEVKRTMGQSFKDYLEIGGLYAPDAISDFEGMRNYINTAILDNIESSFNRNIGLANTYNLSDISSEELRVTIFMILYAVVYSTASKIRQPNIKRIIKMFDRDKTSPSQSIAALREIVFNDLKLSTTFIPNESQVNAILGILERIGILVKAQNFYDNSETNYYITNPSITVRIYYSIYSSLKSTGLDTLIWASLKPVLGLVFESVIVVHTKKYVDDKGYNIYYYRDSDGREVDLLIENERDFTDIFNPYYCYFEIKMTSDIDEAVMKSKWLNDESIIQSILQNGDIIGRGIIYGGIKEGVFTHFSRKMYSDGNIDEVIMEEKNQGTLLIPCENYILNTGKYLKVLE